MINLSIVVVSASGLSSFHIIAGNLKGCVGSIAVIGMGSEISETCSDSS